MIRPALMIAMCLAVGSANAADLATTNELPAALKALNADHSKIVTSADAQKIRGEGGGKGKAWGHSKRGGVNSGINFGIIGGCNVTVNIVNSKNVRIGSHNHLKFK